MFITNIESMLLFSALSQILEGKSVQIRHDEQLGELLLDSRKAAKSPGAVFFAIKGQRHDGHQYIIDLYNKGIRQFILEKDGKVNISLLPEASIIKVENAVEALQKLAAFHRSQFSLPVIAITGSNAKTIIKEWLSQLLAQDEFIVKSPRSYNSQIGVPLSVWQINAQHTLGIFEAGISQIGEMAALEAIIKPTLGLFTNIGEAHADGFASTYVKIIEKLILFKDVQTLFYCRDQELIHEAIQTQSFKKTYAWSAKGLEADAEVQIQKQGTHTAINWTDKIGHMSLEFAHTDDASIENALHCVAIMRHWHIDEQDIQERLNALRTVAMRLEMKEAVNHCHVIDDTYNNDLAGLHTALDFMQQQKYNARRTVILSDLLETGLSEEVLYRRIANILHEKDIERLIGIGPAISRHAKLFDMPKVFYASTDEFIAHFDQSHFNNELILVKGARKFTFEKLVEKLQEKLHGTVMEINLNALAHNLNFYKSLLKPNTKVMAMVKAFAYGSGSYEIAALLEYHKADYLAVAYVDEGVVLRQAGISLPIMVMNPASDSLERMIRYRLEPEIYNIAQLEAFVKQLPLHEVLPIHIAVDTGMHRLGFEIPAIGELAVALLNLEEHVRVCSVFSHLVGADEAEHNAFSHQQIAILNEAADQIATIVKYPFMRHICNSAGIVRFPEAHMDMVRLGIGLYGVEATAMQQDQLMPVSTLKTTISQIKHIKKGETVGYSRKGFAESDITTATIAIGYGDGFSRRFSNGVGKVWINGKTAPIIGNVCMDMTMINITDINAKEGDEVIIFGPQHSLIAQADAIGTIPYEILTNVSARVKRVFVKE